MQPRDTPSVVISIFFFYIKKNVFFFIWTKNSKVWELAFLGSFLFLARPKALKWPLLSFNATASFLCPIVLFFWGSFCKCFLFSTKTKKVFKINWPRELCVFVSHTRFIIDFSNELLHYSFIYYARDIAKGEIIIFIIIIKTNNWNSVNLYTLLVIYNSIFFYLFKQKQTN